MNFISWILKKTNNCSNLSIQAWWAAIYGGAQSRTRLKRLSSSIQSLFCFIEKSENNTKLVWGLYRGIRDSGFFPLALLKIATKLIYAMRVKDFWTLSQLATEWIAEDHAFFCLLFFAFYFFYLAFSRL